MDENSEATHTVRSRISVAAILSAIAFSIVGARLVDLTILNGHHDSGMALTQPMTQMTRADLVDRNGVLIARGLPVSDLYATPAVFWNKEEAIAGLADVTGARAMRLREVFAPDRGYVLVARALTPDTRAEVMRLGLPGLFFEAGAKRV